MKTALKFAVWACLSAGFFAAPASALEIELPVGARLTAERLSVLDSFDAPVAVFDGEVVPHLIVEGAIERRAWRINSPGLTPLQVILPLREQLVRQGYDLVFECSARECGGFDFRFDVEVLPGPNMYVNIAEYRYLTAVNPFDIFLLHRCHSGHLHQNPLHHLHSQMKFAKSKQST